VLLFDAGGQSLETARVCGCSRARLRAQLADADVVWNFCCALREPLLSAFRRRALIDLDPGVIHVGEAGHGVDLEIARHETLLTVGLRLHEPDCAVPTLGRSWTPFVPFVYLPLWSPRPDPGPAAPFTSVTQWTWGELWLGSRVLSLSKRAAYLRNLSLPRRAGRSFELAANIHPGDDSGDRELLLANGWALADPNRVARLPSFYRGYIRASRAELCCPKPIFRELRSGWFSDRSAAYLASGRPVLAEETGFGGVLPTGRGLLTFTSVEEACERVREIDADYRRHSRAARELAEEHLDSRRTLAAMLEACA
jgi:hypothetical protein